MKEEVRKFTGAEKEHFRASHVRAKISKEKSLKKAENGKNMDKYYKQAGHLS